MICLLDPLIGIWFSSGWCKNVVLGVCAWNVVGGHIPVTTMARFAAVVGRKRMLERRKLKRKEMAYLARSKAIGGGGRSRRGHSKESIDRGMGKLSESYRMFLFVCFASVYRYELQCTGRVFLSVGASGGRSRRVWPK